MFCYVFAVFSGRTKAAGEEAAREAEESARAAEAAREKLDAFREH